MAERGREIISTRDQLQIMANLLKKVSFDVMGDITGTPELESNRTRSLSELTGAIRVLELLARGNSASDIADGFYSDYRARRDQLESVPRKTPSQRLRDALGYSERNSLGR